MLSSIVVDSNGTKLAYIDSSAPPSGGEYITIFALNGLSLTSAVFQKVSALSRTKGVRFVSINRRDYKGSTPLSEGERVVVLNGTDAEKADWLMRRGIEIATFIDAFIQQEKLPQITSDGKKGGIALLGWSLGATFSCSAIAHIGALPCSVQTRLASHVRAHIMLEPPSITLGLPIPTQTYMPWTDPRLPENARAHIFAQWISAYFQHGDLSSRDTKVLEYVTPATFRAPSIWNMSLNEIADIMEEGPFPIDGLYGQNFMLQSYAVFKTASFNQAVKAQLPHMKIWEVAGDASPSLFMPAFWTIQDEDKAHGGNNVNYKLLPGMNHIMHWDEPEKTVEAFLEMLS